MESKKINLKKILNTLIISMSILLVGIFIGICFFLPVSNVKALDKATIVDTYNINFVSAKTKIRQATDYSLETIDNSETFEDNRVEKSFSRYNYTYNDNQNSFNYDTAGNTTKLYYSGNAYDIYNNSNGDMNLVTTRNGQTISLPTYKDYYSNFADPTSTDTIKLEGFIPYGVNSYKDVNGNINDIFYDEFDNNDVVILNNDIATSYKNSSNAFNVENIYLSFGDPYFVNNKIKSTALASLRVEATFYPANVNSESHTLILNHAISNTINLNREGLDDPQSVYWHQYLDLKNLKAQITVQETGGQKQLEYNLNNQEGKYVFRFYFIRWNEDFTGTIKGDGNLTNNGEEVFEYTFYVYDSNTFSDYPTISNAEVGLQKQEVMKEYFYNFQNDLPTLTYDPSKFNLSYTRENVEIIDKVTSSFTIKNYQKGNNEYYPLGIITYNNGAQIIKTVYILVYPNSDYTQVQYIYACNDGEEIPISTYNYFINLLENENITFEYKDIENLTYYNGGSPQTRTIKRFRTYEYDDVDVSITNTTPGNKFTQTSSDIQELSSYTNLTTSQKLLDATISPEKLNIHYTYDLTFDRLGVYTFDYKYIATYYNSELTSFQRLICEQISDDLKINPLTTNSSNVTLPIDYNQYNTLSINAFNKMKANTTPTIDTESAIDTQDVYLNISSLLTPTETGYTSKMFGGDLTITNNAGTEVINNSSMPTNISIPQDYSFDTEFEIIIGQDTKVTLDAYFTKEYKGLDALITLKIKIGKIRYTSLTYSYGLEYKDGETVVDSGVYSEVRYNIESYVYSKDSNYLDLVNAKISNTEAGASELKSFVENFGEFTTPTSNFETYIGSSTINANIHNNISTELKSYTQHNDRLHVFGSIAYFAKEDSSTDAKLAEFKLIDNKNNKEYYSDFSADIGTGNTYVGKDINTAPAGYDARVKESIVNKVIVTDVTPIQFKNLSTLTYSDVYVSNSRIYRYTNYKVVYNNDDTKSIYFQEGSKITTDLSTSSYIQHDGYYEVYIEYTYTNYKKYNKDQTTQTFSQLFAFVIDNTSPEFAIELKNDDGTYSPIDANVYTNKDVRISWKKPTYFQHSVYLEINKEYFNGYKHETIGNFNAYYNAQYKDQTKSSVENKENNIISNYEVTQGYINHVTSTKDDNDTTADRINNYYVYISSKDPNNYSLNGCYDISIHYSSDGNSILTESFIIDTLPIDGQEILEIFKNNSDQYVVGYAHESQIINSAFTFIYNPKISGAKISTYWHKIQFNSSNDYDKLFETDNNKTAITTNYSIYGDDDNIAIETEYLYNYNIKTSYDSQFGLVKGDGLVENGCYFTAESSSIYLFRMIDEAGNTSEYVVMVDRTNPRYIVTPTVTNKNNIVNDTTEIIWSDYKAIELETPEGFDLAKVETDEKSSVARLKQSLNYILDNKNNSSFENLQIKTINGKQYVLLPVDYTYIEDVNYSDERNIDTSSSEPTKLYLFPADPTIMYDHDNESSTPDVLGVQLPKYDGNGKAVYDNNGSLQKVTYPVVGTPNYTNVTDLSNYTVSRRISLTYTANGTNIKLSGVIGSGTFNFSVYDMIGNHSDGLIWMNLDKTQTFGYALFDYSGKIKNSVGLISEVADTYALSRLYMTSLKSDGTAIPHYEVTYKYYSYNSSLYSNYDITEAKILSESNGMYLLLKMTTKAGITPAHEQEVKIQLTEKDIDGNEYQYPTHTYPYDLAGDAIISNAAGNPEDIYKDHIDSYVDPDEPNRIFSTTINMNRDDKGNDVTEEGLYIFKREYTQSNINLGTDSRIIYRIYYVDRSGIINITTDNSISSNLYEIGKDINYVLGDNYTGDNPNYKVNITAENIQNKQTSKVSTTANTYNVANNLFETNKIRVAFNLTTDKYNFNNFVNLYNDVTNLLNKESNNYSQVMIYENASDFMRYTLLNSSMFEDNLYKVDLKLTFGSIPLIDESYTSVTDKFNDKYIKTYLRGDAYSGSGYDAKRSNNFNFFYGDINSSYNSGLGDQAGYKTIDLNTKEIIIHTEANQLEMNFYINHNAPSGEIYGKYGDVNYDENDPNKEEPSSSSIPLIDSDPNPDVTKLSYQLISAYWAQGDLQALTTVNNQNIDLSGNYVKLASINNETLVFMFAISDDNTKAQIDPNNIKIYKDGTNNSNIIFNRTTAAQNLWGTSAVSVERMERAFIDEVIDNIHYYAIIIFDDNLDDILDDDEQDYKNLRLLDPLDLNDGDENFLENTDDSTYYVDLQYIGDNRDDYQGIFGGYTVNYYSSRYEITVDRIKPTYNLAKLMDLDNYVYNSVSTTLTKQNYLNVFDEYKPYYNYKLDEEHEFERSDVENYFFAVDSRKNYSTNTDISFTFESVNKQDSNSSIYIRKIDPKNYKFSLTPDDIKAYKDGSYLSNLTQQFTPSTAILVDDIFLENNPTIAYDNYYEILFDAYGGDISVYELCQDGILELSNYYEIIEHDEAGNYRVYAIYVPDLSNDKNSVAYNYKINNSTDTIYESLSFGFYPYATPSGLSFRLNSIKTEDKYLKAYIDIDSTTLLDSLVIYYNPLNTTMYITTSKNIILDSYKISDAEKYKEEFIAIINEKIEYYENLMRDENSSYYSQYGFNLALSIVNRVGVLSQGALHNYEFNYSVAGSVLVPIVTYGSDVFSMIIPAKTGSTYITKIRAYRFNSSWQSIDVDSKGQSFYKSVNDLMNGVGVKAGTDPYIFTRGVYMFNITDNYNRTNVYYEEIGVASIQKGGQFNFSGNYVTKEDGYTYTAQNTTFSYDSSVYDIQIKFSGLAKDLNGLQDPTTGEYPNIMYSSKLIYSSKDKSTYLPNLENYGISSSITTIGNVTTITFKGVTDLSQYDIKVIHSITSENYNWGDELIDTTIFVYDKKLAIYDVIPQVVIRNMNGSILDTSNQLNLTEDFELLISWPTSAITRINFNPVIELTRKYQENGIVRSYTQKVQSGYVVSLPGEYTARVVNDLGARSNLISFTRGDGDISMYAVYSINNETLFTETKLNPSLYVEKHNDNNIIFTYYTNADYFAYIDEFGIANYTNYLNNANTFGPDHLETFSINKSANKYIEVRVNSNLNIFAQICEIGLTDDSLGGLSKYPYVMYRIYTTSISSEGETNVYTYRYIRIIYLESNNSTINLASLQVNGVNSNTSLVKSTDSKINISFAFTNSQTGQSYVPVGDAIYVERYYNGNLLDSTMLDMVNITESTALSFNIKTVGLYEFILRDLAGRTHKFNIDNKTTTDKLQVYLINQILYYVNGTTPLNNQVFNDNVNITVISELSGLTLYNATSIGVTVTKNGKEISSNENTSNLSFSEPGYYTIRMVATTTISNGTANIANQEITSTYNFTIIKTNVAQNNFSISKGKGLILDKLIKKSGEEIYDLTEEYLAYIATDKSMSTNSLWLTYDSKYEGSKIFGNATYTITLKAFNNVTEKYEPFTFNIWINNEKPTIISNIPAGSETKDAITIDFNPGLIYSQIGKCYLQLDGNSVVTIDENSQSTVTTLTISTDGTHILKIVSEDGSIISSYKYIKSAPLNNTAKIVIIISVGVVIVLVGIFFFIRRKGKYR